MKLVVFDVDGTLIDSQHMIVSSMNAGMDAAGLPHLPREAILSIVGLSLPVAVATLLPDASHDQQDKVTAGYRTAYMASRMHLESPLYPGARACLDALAGRDDLLLGIATGKSRRGLDAMLDHHGLRGHFVTLQNADNHPSKPHPAMLEELMDELGAVPERTLMIGDTTHDLQMAKNARTAGVAVSFGAHPVAALEAEAPLACVHAPRELARWLALADMRWVWLRPRAAT